MDQVPIGTIMMYGGSSETIPAGWLYCNGEQHSSVTYAQLAGVIGNNFGASADPQQFYVPDMRGQFVRGFDDNRGLDPDAGTRTTMQSPTTTYSGVGSIQSHALQNHYHSYPQFPNGEGDIASGNEWKADWTVTGGIDSSTANVSTETRPTNVYLIFIIYAGSE
jgi:microcystin-dependent protein